MKILQKIEKVGYLHVGHVHTSKQCNLQVWQVFDSIHTDDSLCNDHDLHVLVLVSAIVAPKQLS